MQGNVEPLTYYFISDCTTLFALNSKMMLFNFLVILLFFCFIITIFCGYFALKLYYKKNARFLLDNCKNNVSGISFKIVHFGLFNFALGVAHLTGYNTI